MRQPPPRKPVAKATTAVAGLDAMVEVRRHPKARRMTLRVSRTKGTVIVTVPLRCNVEDAGTFVNRHLDWVRDRLDTLPQPIPFTHGLILPLRGHAHRLVFTNAKGEGPLVALKAPMSHADAGIDPDRPSRSSPMPTIEVNGRASSASRHLARWLVEQARDDLDRQVDYHARRIGVTPKKIAVRDQTSRWGSCSTTRVLSFSWRLVLAPPSVLDYVAAHEVAHLAEMNHGPRFWALVEKMVPDMDDARRWLVVYGSEIHRYGR